MESGTYITAKNRGGGGVDLKISSFLNFTTNMDQKDMGVGGGSKR